MDDKGENWTLEKYGGKNLFIRFQRYRTRHQINHKPYSFLFWRSWKETIFVQRGGGGMIYFSIWEKYIRRRVRRGFSRRKRYSNSKTNVSGFPTRLKRSTWWKSSPSSSPRPHKKKIVIKPLELSKSVRYFFENESCKFWMRFYLLRRGEGRRVEKRNIATIFKSSTEY